MYVTPRAWWVARALASVPHPGVAVDVVKVAHSYQQLETLTLKIAGARRGLEKSGVRLQFWAPDPGTDTVMITLATPTGLTQVDARQHVIEERGVLTRTYGSSWITIARQTGPAMVAMSRDNDSVPYYEGDGIDYPYLSVACTSGWSTTGANGEGIG